MFWITDKFVWQDKNLPRKDSGVYVKGKDYESARDEDISLWHAKNRHNMKK